MDYNALLSARFSCRKFSEQPVEQEKIDHILKAARLAPTAVNKQPFHIWVMQSPEAVKAIRSCTQCHFDAGIFLVVGADKKSGWVRKFDDRPFADVDATIAATHIMLAITDAGLASTWVGFFDAPKLQTIYPQMKETDLIAIFPIGYPAEGPSPRHTERKEMTDLVTVL